MTLAEAQTELATISAILDAGVKVSRSIEGQMIEWDLEVLARRRERLEAFIANSARGATSKGVYHA